MNLETHQVNSGAELRDEFPAPLLAVLDFGQGLGVRTLSELGGEGAQADVVAGLLLVEASHSLCLQLCHKGGKHEISRSKSGQTTYDIWLCVVSVKILTDLRFKRSFCTLE